MKGIIVLLLLLLLPTEGFSQYDYVIETKDIDNFWRAFDQLAEASSPADSIAIMQKQYLDEASAYFEKFIELRNFTAEEYVDKIDRYLKFWRSIRPLTENIVNRKPAIEAIFKTYRDSFPAYDQPNVCFAIGCLRTGGTTSKDLILIGAEIAASTPAVDKSEMRGWLASVIGNSGDIVSMIAHETVHTQQYDPRMVVSGKQQLLEQTLKEGIADFITTKFFGLNINQALHAYGEAHECELWQAFAKDLETHPKEYRSWLYQGGKKMGRPADLGYYIGFKIAESYYAKQPHKDKALQTLLNIGKYRKVFAKSRYWEESCG